MRYTHRGECPYHLSVPIICHLFFQNGSKRDIASRVWWKSGCMVLLCFNCSRCSSLCTRWLASPIARYRGSSIGACRMTCFWMSLLLSISMVLYAPGDSVGYPSFSSCQSSAALYPSPFHCHVLQDQPTFWCFAHFAVQNCSFYRRDGTIHDKSRFLNVPFARANSTPKRDAPW